MNLIKRFFNFINNISPVFILTPHEGGIGNCAEEIYFGFLYARKKKKRILLLRQNAIFGVPRIPYEIYNLRCHNSLIWGAFFFQFLGNLFLTLYYGYLPACSKYLYLNIKQGFIFIKQIVNYFTTDNQQAFPRPIRHYFKNQFTRSTIGNQQIWNRQQLNFFSWDVAESINWENELTNNMPIYFSSKKQKQADQFRFEMGLPNTSWYVCLHLREGGFNNDYRDHRNSNIMNTMGAIRMITNQGGWVVRMGDNTMTPLPKMDRVIDYPFTKFKSELMDLYLVKNCRFYLGGNTGIYDCAMLFQKKRVAINSTEWSYSFPFSKNSLVILKHIFSKSRNRILSIQELLEEDFHWQDLYGHNDDYTFIENTSEEIAEVVAEIFSQDSAGYLYSDLQNEFIKKRRIQVRKWLETENLFLKKEQDVLEKYRIASRAIFSEGTLGKSYLEKNWDKH